MTRRLGDEAGSETCGVGVHLLRSNSSKIERARLGVSLPFSVEDDIASTTQRAGESVNDVRILSILRKIARERSGSISSVIRSSFRWMKTSQPLRRNVRTLAMYLNDGCYGNEKWVVKLGVGRILHKCSGLFRFQACDGGASALHEKRDVGDPQQCRDAERASNGAPSAWTSSPHEKPWWKHYGFGVLMLGVTYHTLMAMISRTEPHMR